MKKWCLAALALFSCSFAEAQNLEKEEVLSSKICLQDQTGYFVLTDGSCWKVMGFVPRWRSISEWWNNVELVPDNYKCEPGQWVVGAAIQAYPKYGNIEVNLADASNLEALNQCTHLLFNTRTGQVLFAIAMDTGHCLADVFREAYREGRVKGVEEGYAKARSDANTIYESGRAAGYQAGYAAGYKAAMGGERGEVR